MREKTHNIYASDIFIIENYTLGKGMRKFQKSNLRGKCENIFRK